MTNSFHDGRAEHQIKEITVTKDKRGDVLISVIPQHDESSEVVFNLKLAPANAIASAVARTGKAGSVRLTLTEDGRLSQDWSMAKNKTPYETPAYSKVADKNVKRSGKPTETLTLSKNKMIERATQAYVNDDMNEHELEETIEDILTSNRP